MQALLAPSFPDGTHNYWKSTLQRQLSDDAVAAISTMQTVCFRHSRQSFSNTMAAPPVGFPETQCRRLHGVNEIGWRPWAAVEGDAGTGFVGERVVAGEVQDGQGRGSSISRRTADQFGEDVAITDPGSEQRADGVDLVQRVGGGGRHDVSRAADRQRRHPPGGIGAPNDGELLGQEAVVVASVQRIQQFPGNDVARRRW
jgi:hypothetical protein